MPAMFFLTHQRAAEACFLAHGALISQHATPHALPEIVTPDRIRPTVQFQS